MRFIMLIFIPKLRVISSPQLVTTIGHRIHDGKLSIKYNISLILLNVNQNVTTFMIET